jgi:hypothetical protein
MSLLKLLGIAVLLIAVAAAMAGVMLHAGDRRQADDVRASLMALREDDPPRFHPDMVADLPEIAQRYFSRAIEPGTPLHRVVQLQMDGTFVLGTNPMPMRATQILAPPARGFVWQAAIGAGLMRFAGSDGYHEPDGAARDSWTKFWMYGLIPLARISTSEDHARAAATRALLESIWVPAALLPQFGAHWTQSGANSAEIRFDLDINIEPMQIVFDENGTPTEVVALRWSDANPEQTYRLQPFGGRMLEMGRFQGFLIPTRVELGNHFGTPEYAPFFMATVSEAQF